METPFTNAKNRKHKIHILLGHGTEFEENEFGDFANAKYNDSALIFGFLNGILSFVPGLICWYIFYQYGIENTVEP